MTALYHAFLFPEHWARVLFTYSTNTDSDVVLTFKELAFWRGRYTNIR